MIENKSIVSSLDFTCSFPSVTIGDGSTFSVQGIKFDNATTFPISIFGSQNGENISLLPYSDATTDSAIVSASHCSSQGQTPLHISPYFSLCILFTLVSLFSCLYFFYGLIFCSQVCVISPVYPRMERYHEGRNDGSITNGHLGFCCSSSREESR